MRLSREFARGSFFFFFFYLRICHVSAHQYDEGHTVAGWTGFGIATVEGTSVLRRRACAWCRFRSWSGGVGAIVVGGSSSSPGRCFSPAGASRRGRRPRGGVGDAGAGPVRAGRAHRVCRVPLAGRGIRAYGRGGSAGARGGEPEPATVRPGWLSRRVITLLSVPQVTPVVGAVGRPRCQCRALRS